MAVATEEDLLALIAQEVGRADSLNEGEIAARILPEISRAELERLSFKAVRREVVDYLASLRPPTNGRLPRSARWEMVNEDDPLDGWTVNFPDRDPKRLLECAPEDLEDSIDWYEKRAAGYLRRAEAYRALATEIRRAGAKTAGDLPRERVRRVLNV